MCGASSSDLLQTKGTAEILWCGEAVNPDTLFKYNHNSHTNRITLGFQHYSSCFPMIWLLSLSTLVRCTLISCCGNNTTTQLHTGSALHSKWVRVGGKQSQPV